MSPPNPPVLLAFGVLPAAVVALGGLAGYLNWQDSSREDAGVAAAESVAAARDAAAAILSYHADTAAKELHGARDLLTGAFLADYTALIDDVVIPGARQKRISAVAQVPAAASVSATPSHAVALVFVDQTTTVGTDPPTVTASSVRITLDKVGGRWLVSGFDPV